MAANTIPIYTKIGKTGGLGVVLTTAVTALTGVGASLLFTAGADGSRIERIRAKPLGTNVATVLRIFINNGSDPATAANNILYSEKTIAANTLSQAAESVLNEFPNATDPTAFPLVLPPAYRIYATIGTTIASGLHVTVVGGDY
jgi:hypothetical protein